MAICNAEVPLTVAIAYFAPVNLAIAFSKSPTLLPTDETKLESMHSVKYFFSLPSNIGL